MAKEVRTVPVCGYQMGEDGIKSKIFQLPEDETNDLPEGWFDSPARITDEPEGDEDLTAEQLIDAAEDMHHSTLRAHAVKILGDENTPSKKAEILEALLKSV